MRLLWVFFCLLSVKAFAQEILPFACQPLMVKAQALDIATEKPVLLLVHNLSQSDLWLTHVLADSSANAAWSTRLQADHWSALAVEKGAFSVSCIESQPGHEQQVACSEVLAVCEWSIPALPQAQSSGTFWAAEDMSLPSLTARLGRNGFKLPIEK